MNIFPILDAATPVGGTGTGLMVTIVYAAVIIAFMYLVILRPQKKQQKAAQTMLSTVEKGDSILTSSGFYGVIIDIMDDVVVVEFGNNKNCRILMKKSAIVEVEKAEGAKEE